MILTRTDLRASPIGTGLIIHKHPTNIGTVPNMKNRTSGSSHLQQLPQDPSTVRAEIWCSWNHPRMNGATNYYGHLYSS